MCSDLPLGYTPHFFSPHVCVRVCRPWCSCVSRGQSAGVVSLFTMWAAPSSDHQIWEQGTVRTEPSCWPPFPFYSGTEFHNAAYVGLHL